MDEGRAARPDQGLQQGRARKLGALAPGYDWKRYLDSAGVEGKVTYLIVGQPSYITAFAKILDQTPLPVWKAYFRWHLLSAFAPYLSKPYVDANFAFFGTALNGTPEIRPRWKRGVQLVDDSIGRIWAGLRRAILSAGSKARMDALSQSFSAYRQSIGDLDWMSSTTKAKALDKLAKFMPKIGYPKKWRDYSTLRIVSTDLVGNVMRANEFEYRRNIAKLASHRSRRMAADTADGQRLLQPGAQRDCFPRGHPAAAPLRRSSGRRGQLRRDRRGDRS